MGTQNPAIARRVMFRTTAPLSAVHLLVGGLLMIPAFVFQPSLVVRYTQILLFVLLAALSGRRVAVTPNLIVLLSVVVANLLSPLGLVLFRIGPLPITLGALKEGLYKAALLIGLIYVSRFSVRDDLVLPGRLGRLVALVFFYFGQITERREAFSLRGDAPSGPNEGGRGARSAGRALLRRVDDLLVSLQFGAAPEAPRERVASSPRGVALLSAIVLLNWLSLLFLRGLP